MSEKPDKTVAYALLSATELVQLGPSLQRVFHIPEDNSFDDLLARLERVDTASDSGRQDR